MALHHQGDRERAEAELKAVRDPVERAVFLSDESSQPAPGNWYAWAVARILFREANGFIDIP